MQISHKDITPELLFNQRRSFLKLGAASMIASSALIELMAKEDLPLPDLIFKKDPNRDHLELNSFKEITSYNNFYEFTTSKKGVKALAKQMNTEGWKITIDGLVEKPLTLDVKELTKRYPLEERIYRFRCVEGWAMVVPWVGFELRKLIQDVKPLKRAKYVQFWTKYDEAMFPDQKRGLFATITYPYTEGLRMDEAMHPLTLLAVGLYGKTLENQNGAPIRLVVPWKYGFKSIKSIDRISLIEKQPLNTWQKENPREFGFYANVNPEVDHPRWSQKTERVLGKFVKQRTLLFNGYEKEVGYMYKDMDLRKEI
ncbi:protein-methionine-sulfoxide reductase catalytic subunit MsrP [Sulfurovum sp. TSL1]|uniref:protein-methionine-sulfoxide reductase catalytic subunit MsrP n=1 Tax=Sulfurovum sp. TSL1 TaxID=2826994 RepID=UPI001CC5B6FB|nr:protein-methionine-sulfoxide reductase catalytic subunit MsrP [Sulfurovum sp. TSL1]GIT98893.1 protein-methionine-sulfoxide reductase catalytic subunit MsrP [Sulfurovum sp. TSL1]